MSVNLVKLCDGIRSLADWERELRQLGETERADKVRDQIVEFGAMASKMRAETRAGFLAKTKCLDAIIGASSDHAEHAVVRALQEAIAVDRQRFGLDGHAL